MQLDREPDAHSLLPSLLVNLLLGAHAPFARVALEARKHRASKVRDG